MNFSDPFGLCPWCESQFQRLANFGARRGGFLGGLALNAGAAGNAALEASGINDAFRAGEALSEGRYGTALASAVFALPGFGKSGKAAKGFGNIGGGFGHVDQILNAAEGWLGVGYREIGPGVFRSADDARQFRMTASDLTDARQGAHVHFEAIGPDGREIIENSHVIIRNE